MGRRLATEQVLLQGGGVDFDSSKTLILILRPSPYRDFGVDLLVNPLVFTKHAPKFSEKSNGHPSC
ncbi:hypothetical protein LCGC14_2652490, partial [marine sediment metagenome]